MIYVLITLLYFLGVVVSFYMIKIEVRSERDVFTMGDKVVAGMISLLSWLSFLILVCRGWFLYIGATGYWKLPANGKKTIE